ncbi:nectin-3-like protein isoform X2 [Clupea harengus]|uniref:Nectin-3-like protein isoform X2 n=1 Tax=Clupea harengus TaxID=7950 RepID=A0A6P8GUE6_CLUHA|nr:nectin-3-like protein isoform X2 [Clupea harengus]
MKTCLRYQPICLKERKAWPQKYTLLLLSFLRISQAINIIGDDKEVITGETVELVCKLSGDGAEVLRVDWMRKTLKKPEKKIFTIIRNKDATPEEENGLKDRLQFTGSIPQGIGNIRLQDARLQDIGNYSCRFVLFEGSPVSKSIQLKVQARPEINIPTITPLVGTSEATLATCRADVAHPPAEVFWNASSLRISVRSITNSTENPDGSMNVSCSLMGVPSRDILNKEVLCLVRHPTLERQRTIPYSINIHYPPQSTKVTPLESPSSSPVFQCQADANPRPDNYTWTRNGLPLSNNGVKADGNKLYFQKLHSDMNGLYDCEASNIYGSATCSLQFYIISTSRDKFFLWIPFTVFLCFLTFCIFNNRSALKSSVTALMTRFQAPDSRRQSEDSVIEESGESSQLQPAVLTAPVSRGKSEDTPQELLEQKPSGIEESGESSQLQHTAQSLKESQEGSSEQSSCLTQKDARSLGEKT